MQTNILFILKSKDKKDDHKSRKTSFKISGKTTLKKFINSFYYYKHYQNIQIEKTKIDTLISLLQTLS